MIAAILLAVAAPQTAVDAERAFAAMAQTEGQWTAFRAFAAPEAILFTPKPQNAHEALKDAKNPQISIMWWPGFSWVSCDGDLAINTGPSLHAGGKRHGSFTTVWQRQSDGGWKWLADNGRDMAKTIPAREEALVRTARCAGIAPFDPAKAIVSHGILLQWEGQQASFGLDDPDALPDEGERIAEGASPDGSLHWRYSKLPAIGPDAFGLSVWLWNGNHHELVIHEISGLPKA